jgi:hypothetical protein
MKFKTVLFVLTAGAFLASCAPKVAAIDAVVGNYSGTISAGAMDTTASCLIEKINDNLVKMTCNPTGGGGFYLDSISISGTENPYSLTKTGFSGSVNGNTLTWTSTPYSFTGTK